ncbi:MAG TPA: TIGR02391 family protein, partial [Balneolaceae bacterium]|nr:TIGR02391 family protein [Balneolaceae bacterium]
CSEMGGTMTSEIATLVDEIASEPLDQYKNGHFNEAVRKSCERFEHKIQEETGESDFGASLMGKAFNKDHPLIKINDLESENDISEQDGYQKLAIGAMFAIRNMFSHGDEDQRSPEEAYEMLLFMNWMFRKLDSNH